MRTREKGKGNGRQKDNEDTMRKGRQEGEKGNKRRKGKQRDRREESGVSAIFVCIWSRVRH